MDTHRTSVYDVSVIGDCRLTGNATISANSSSNRNSHISNSSNAYIRDKIRHC